jgi:hypothetical protein
MTDSSNAPSWLFSFVDLAFLLLIAMTQLAQDAIPPAPDLGSIVLPQIDEQAKRALPSEAHERWQVRVHPDEPDGNPFEVAFLSEGGMAPGERLAHAGLVRELARLEKEGIRKPLLAPHEDSRSQDMLDAVAALETLWPGKRQAAITPRIRQQ